MTHDLTASLKKLRESFEATREAKKPEPKESNDFQKRISTYADEIMAIETREDRAEALLKIPSDCRGWVEAEVRIRFDQRKKEKPCTPPT